LLKNWAPQQKEEAEATTYIKVINIGPTLISLWKVEISEMKTEGTNECGN
jgi:hypothetical protein